MRGILQGLTINVEGQLCPSLGGIYAISRAKHC